MAGSQHSINFLLKLSQPLVKCATEKEIAAEEKTCKEQVNYWLLLLVSDGIITLQDAQPDYHELFITGNTFTKWTTRAPVICAAKMLKASSQPHRHQSEEDSSGSDAGSEVSLEPETDRFGFILTNGSTAGWVHLQDAGELLLYCEEG